MTDAVRHRIFGPQPPFEHPVTLWLTAAAGGLLAVSPARLFEQPGAASAETSSAQSARRKSVITRFFSRNEFVGDRRIYAKSRAEVKRPRARLDCCLLFRG